MLRKRVLSFFGVPCWLFGVVWFPVVFLVGLLTTRLGRTSLNKELLVVLAIGNLFTAYLLYLDIMVVKTYNPVYVALYATNYATTGLVVIDNWSNDIMHGYVYGTGTGAVIGLVFGPYGVAAVGICGGIFGALATYLVPKKLRQLAVIKLRESASKRRGKHLRGSSRRSRLDLQK